MKEISVIVPVFNEESSIGSTLEALADQLNKDLGYHLKETAVGDGRPEYPCSFLLSEKKYRFEIIAVNDGSTDGTGRILKELSKKMEWLVVEGHEKNRGFGRAIMTGVNRASGENLLLVPADGQFDPQEIGYFLEALEENDIVIGTRTEWGGYRLLRQIQSMVYLKLVNFLFNQTYPDVNWVQAWKKKVFELMDPVSNGVFILQEIITRGRMNNLKIARVKSIQLPRKSGKAHGGRLKTILITIWEMFVFRVKVYCPWRFAGGN